MSRLGSWLRPQVTLRAEPQGVQELTPRQRVALMQMTGMEGWPVFLDLFEQECLKALGSALGAANDEAERRAMMQARALSVAFVELQKRVQFEITEAVGAEAPAPQPSEEDKAAANVLSATARYE